MSLRDALRARVACCTPQEMQHATLAAERATADATGMQLPAASPHQHSLRSATEHGTSVQLGSCMAPKEGTGIRPKSCTSCRHRSSHGTCREPVAAGLSAHFMIVWPELGHGATCPAWHRDPFEAQTLVFIEAARRHRTSAERDAWLADADADPAAVLDVLRGMP